MNNVVCPKPRRLNHEAINESGLCDYEDGNQLLDMFLTKEYYGVHRANNPFFCGSPPSRSSNPLIQDAQFVNEISSVSSPVFEVSPSSTRGSVKLGQKPAVRVEGFNRQGISAVAY